MTLLQYFNISHDSIAFTLISRPCLWLIMYESAGNFIRKKTKLFVLCDDPACVCVSFLTTTANCSDSAKSLYSSFISARTPSCSASGRSLIRLYETRRAEYTLHDHQDMDASQHIPLARRRSTQNTKTWPRTQMSSGRVSQCEGQSVSRFR